jgi:hypothetical protein
MCAGGGSTIHPHPDHVRCGDGGRPRHSRPCSGSSEPRPPPHVNAVPEAPPRAHGGGLLDTEHADLSQTDGFSGRSTGPREPVSSVRDRSGEKGDRSPVRSVPGTRPSVQQRGDFPRARTAQELGRTRLGDQPVRLLVGVHGARFVRVLRPGWASLLSPQAAMAKSVTSSCSAIVRLAPREPPRVRSAMWPLPREVDEVGEDQDEAQEEVVEEGRLPSRLGVKPRRRNLPRR